MDRIRVDYEEHAYFVTGKHWRLIPLRSALLAPYTIQKRTVLELTEPLRWPLPGPYTNQNRTMFELSKAHVQETSGKASMQRVASLAIPR